MIYKAMHDINTLMSTLEGETLIHGKDEDGNELRIVFSTIELLEWLDIDYMKERSKKYIEQL